MGGRHSLRNSEGVGGKMAGLAAVLGVDIEAAALLATRQPNLINRRMETLRTNLDALQESYAWGAGGTNLHMGPIGRLG